LIKSIRKEKYDENLEVFASVCQTDVDSEQLKVHLETLSAILKEKEKLLAFLM